MSLRVKMRLEFTSSTRNKGVKYDREMDSDSGDGEFGGGVDHDKWLMMMMTN